MEALPLRPDSRVLEIGCGPAAAARAVAPYDLVGHSAPACPLGAGLVALRQPTRSDPAWSLCAGPSLGATAITLRQPTRSAPTSTAAG